MLYLRKNNRKNWALILNIPILEQQKLNTFHTDSSITMIAM